jgi:hypothetical protein
MLFVFAMLGSITPSVVINLSACSDLLNSTSGVNCKRIMETCDPPDSLEKINICNDGLRCKLMQKVDLYLNSWAFRDDSGLEHEYTCAPIDKIVQKSDAAFKMQVKWAIIAFCFIVFLILLMYLYYLRQRRNKEQANKRIRELKSASCYSLGSLL